MHIWQLNGLPVILNGHGANRTNEYPARPAIMLMISKFIFESFVDFVEVVANGSVRNAGRPAYFLFGLQL
jgi:hypothetical protein